jgi:hypothetical protein
MLPGKTAIGGAMRFSLQGFFCCLAGRLCYAWKTMAFSVAVHKKQGADRFQPAPAACKKGIRFADAIEEWGLLGFLSTS